MFDQQFEKYNIEPQLEISEQQVRMEDLIPSLNPLDTAKKKILDEIELLSTPLWRKIVWEKPTRSMHHNHPPKGSYLD